MHFLRLQHLILHNYLKKTQQTNHLKNEYRVQAHLYRRQLSPSIFCSIISYLMFLFAQLRPTKRYVFDFYILHFFNCFNYTRYHRHPGNIAGDIWQITTEERVLALRQSSRWKARPESPALLVPRDASWRTSFPKFLVLVEFFQSPPVASCCQRVP